MQKNLRKAPRQHTSVQGWKVIAERKIYFRSNWEVRYAKYLEFLKQIGQITEWEHEPETFWFENIKRGTRSYLPDFKVVKPDGSHYWVEVKGYMDAKSNTKIKRFRKYYPEEELRVVTGKCFKEEILCGSIGEKNLLT